MSNNQRKLGIFICDDQEEMMDNFIEYHNKWYDITKFHSIRDLLDELKSTKNLPDIILMDLFWVKDKVDPEVKLLADTELSKFQASVASLREHIYNAYIPAGIDAIREIRKIGPSAKFPVLIYSRTGQVLLPFNELKQVVELDAEWLPKNQDNMTADIESMIINNYIELNKARWFSKRPPDFQWQLLFAAISALLGVIIGYFVPK